MRIVEWRGRKFLGCEHYPTCKHSRPILSEQIQTLARQTACPQCGKQPLEARSGRYGEYLYCTACKQNWSLKKLGAGAKSASVDVACPACGEAKLEHRHGKYGPYYHCNACGKNHAKAKVGQG